MVKTQHQLVVLFTIFIFITLVGTVTAQRQFHLEHEWANVWINQDGTIDLLYDISITLDSGDPISFVYVGQPKGDFTIGTAMDQYGHTLTTSDESEGGNYRVRVNLFTPLPAGQNVRFNLTTNVAHMIWEDTSENVGMQFTPCWWDYASVHELQVRIVLPLGVTNQTVVTTPNWNNTLVEEKRLVLYWETHNLQPKQKFSCGVSFPKEYVQHYDVPEKGFEWILPVGAFLLIALVAGIIIYKRIPLRKYINPSMRMEALGIRHGLTAVEASHLLGLPPTKIVTEILYSLLMKKAIWVTATTPALKLKIMEMFKDKTGTSETPLRYYEKSFLDAIRKNGALGEEKLAETVVLLRNTVEKKLRGYCRSDTINYYKKFVGESWGQVEKAGTPGLASKAYDKNLLWLLLHEGFRSRTEDVFREKMFEPGIGWWWYWYGYTSYHPHPTYKPSPTTTQPTSPPTIPGADFANNIATSVEKTANNIVANVEKFANSIVPAPPPSAKTSRTPAHHKSNCACACACASGGVG